MVVVSVVSPIAVSMTWATSPTPDAVARRRRAVDLDVQVLSTRDPLRVDVGRARHPSQCLGDTRGEALEDVEVAAVQLRHPLLIARRS